MAKKAQSLHLRMEWLSDEALAVIVREMERSGARAGAAAWLELIDRVGEDEAENLMGDVEVLMDVAAYRHAGREPEEEQ